MPALPSWLKRAPVLIEFIMVLELTLLAAIAVRVVWVDLEDRPSAVALSLLITIVIAHCWFGWWRASHEHDRH